jgi:ribosomal protein S18 acetylase RimI-like enzyme
MTDSVTIAYLIEENLTSLYTLAAEEGHLPYATEEGFSWVNASPNPWPSYIFNASFSQVQAKATIERVNSLIENSIAPAFWIKGPKLNVPNFTEMLSAYNFRHVMAWPGMAFDLKKNAIAAPNPIFEIEEAKTEVQFNDWISISQKILFPNKPVDSSLLLNMLNSGKIKLMLGSIDGKAAGTVMLYINSGIAGFFMVATLPEYRKIGIGRSMMLRSLQIAYESGCSLGVLQANNASQNLYRSIGFQEYCTFDIYWKLGLQ